MQFSAA